MIFLPLPKLGAGFSLTNPNPTRLKKKKLDLNSPHSNQGVFGLWFITYGGEGMFGSWFITDGGDQLFQLVHEPSIIASRFFQAQTNEQLVWPMQSIGLKAYVVNLRWRVAIIISN